MIKSFLRQNRQVLALAVIGAALTFFIPAVSAAGKAPSVAKQAEAQQPGHLLIVRSANLGTVVVGMEIDGKQTARINFGGSYNEPISAGPHVISVTPMPNREHAQPSQTRINVQPGQSYKFTAVQSDVSLVLR